MSEQKRFQELKECFTRQFSIGDRKFQDFKCLLGQAQSHAGKPQLRLLPYHEDELHAIYKQHKFSILSEIIERLNSRNPPYPLDVMQRAIKEELPPGETQITQEQFKQVYAAVMDAERQGTKQAITSAARNELSKILGTGRHSP